MLEDLELKPEAAMGYLEKRFKTPLIELRNKGKAAESCDIVKEATAQLVASWKLLSKEAMDDFIQYCKRFNQASSSMNRLEKKKRRREKQRAEAPRHPRYVRLMETMPPTARNRPTSRF